MRRPIRPLSAAAVLLLAATASGQQNQLGISADLEKQFPKIKYEFSKAISNSDRQKSFPPDLLQTAAKYYVYRVTWPSNLEARPVDPKTDPMVRILKDFDTHIDAVNNGRRQDPAFTNSYAPVLVAHFRELTDLDVVGNARALSYGLQMLPALGRLEHESISDYFVELIDPEKGKHDFVKLWAIRGMREMMPLGGDRPVWGDPFDESDLKNPRKMAQKTAALARVDALMRFILRMPPTNATSEELDAFHYLRREAIETLAQSGAPAVTAVGRIGHIEGPIAPMLLRVLLPGGLTPPATLAERNEAALGLANINVKALDKYEPEFTYHFIGKTLAEMAREYNKDLINLIKADERRPTRFPWRITFKRWEHALTKLAKTSGNKDASQLEARVKNMVKQVIPSDSKANPSPINPGDIAAVAAIGKIPPAEFRLFRSTIQSPALTFQGN